MDKKPEEIVSLLLQKVKNLRDKADVQNVGKVVYVGDGVITVCGLQNVSVMEIIRNDRGEQALVMSLDVSSVGAVVLGDAHGFTQGEEVVSSGKFLDVPVGPELLGRVVNALGDPIDEAGSIETKERRPVECPAPSILDRKSVFNPLQTGVKVLDALVPIGRGQRELIIGDRQVGKTAIAVDAIINQAAINDKLDEKDRVHCVYVAVGHKMSKVVHLAHKLEELGALKYTTIVVASASDSATCQFLAPYVGCAMGEHFRDRGQHALVVYDDLSKQAVAYRAMSLLLRRPPGREAFPGDVFYLHARLLERAAQMSDEKGGGSLTALPIVETQAGDLSSYIATNVISITDGQIFLDTSLFHEGVKPAINVGYSVSRVGSAAQRPAVRALSGKLRLELAQFREMASFAKFASDVNDATKQLLKRGEGLVALFKQYQYETMSLPEQIISLFYFARHKEEEKSVAARIRSVDFLRERLQREKKLWSALENHEKWTDELEKKVEDFYQETVKFLGEKGE